MAETLTKESGIKGIPLLSSLNTLNFPFSFPLNFMHLIFENLIPNLILHYTGTFEKLDSGTEDYKLPKEEWSEICRAARLMTSPPRALLGLFGIDAQRWTGRSQSS
jgi:hypothetical protein